MPEWLHSPSRVAPTTRCRATKPLSRTNTNVYEVTIVVKDGTYDMDGEPHKDELNVTVKVLNSTDDNQPGTVSFSNRQPEVDIALTAMFEDPDGPISSSVEWQWYRSSDNNITNACPNRTPADGPVDAADGVNDRRYFVENDTPDPPVWVEIDTDDARTATYTPKAEDFDTTNNQGYCLRATVTYRDGVDRTHSAANVGTTAVDETPGGDLGSYGTAGEGGRQE